jgi:hypothetical protein
MRAALILIFTSHAVCAQAVTVGVIAAVPLTDTFDTGFIYRGTFAPKTVRYQVGPAVDFRFFGSFRGEIDALYQPFSFSQSFLSGTPTLSRTSGSLWQFPVVLKYRIPTPALKLFVEAGASVQIAANIIQRGEVIILQPTPFVYHPDPTSRAVPGIVVGGGVDFRLGHFLLSPQMRYTRWISENFDFTQTDHVGSHLNEIQVLFSIRL